MTARPTAIVLLLMLAAGSVGAQSEQPAAPGSTVLPVPVLVDGEYLADLDVEITAQEEVRVNPERLLQVLHSLLIDRVRADAERIFVAGRRIPVDRFSQLGISVDFDWDLLGLVVEIPASLVPPVEVRLVAAATAPAGTPVEQEPFSAYANVDLWSRYSYESRQFEYKAAPELVMNAAGVVLEARGGVQSGSVPLFLDYARLVWDIEQLGYRLQVGDLTFQQTDLSGVQRVTGFSLVRNSALVRRSPFSFVQELYVAAPGDLTVYRNEAQLHRRTVEPGNLVLRGLPLVQGINTVVVEWPGSGELQQLELIIPHDTELLSRGELDAGVAVGVADRDALRPMAASYQRYGATDRFTVGTREGVTFLDLSMDLGLDLLLASRIGNVGVAPSFAYTPGGALRLELPLRYRYLDARPSRYRGFGAGGGYVLTRGAGTGTHELYASGYLNVAGADGFSVTPRATYSYNVTAGTGRLEAQAGVRKSIRGGSALTANLGLRYESELSFIATLSYSASFPERRQNFFMQQDLAAQKLSTYWSRYAGDRPQDVDISAGAQIPIDPAEALSLSAHVGYRSPYLQASVSHGLNGIVAESTFRNATALRFESGLALAGGAIVPTAPIADSFIIVRPGSSVSGRSFMVNHVGHGTDTVVTDRPLLVGSVSAHATTQVSVEPQELMLGAASDDLRYVARPGYRSGTVITIDVPRNVYVGGTLVDEEGRALAYQLGTYVSVEPAVRGEFFTDERGYFEIYNLAPGTYLLRLAAYPDAVFRAEVPADASEFHGLGQLPPEVAP